MQNDKIPALVEAAMIAEMSLNRTYQLSQVAALVAAALA